MSTKARNKITFEGFLSRKRNITCNVTSNEIPKLSCSAPAKMSGINGKTDKIFESRIQSNSRLQKFIDLLEVPNLDMGMN